MKKFLSLVLAMIMVMSLVTVGAGATFTDAEDIQYVEAVELMAGLGILQGPGDGTFSPKGNLSRAAAAKIIAYVALGAKAADAMTYDKVIFPDVPTTSSTAPYIAWCAEQGIINGYSDGTFGRQNTVSGHAFLKMVLGALGVYGQYTGTGWQTIVTAAAKEAKLLEGLSEDVVLSQPLTREAACQIAFNAMNYNKAGVKGYLVDGTLFNTLVEAATYINLMKLDAAPKYVYVEAGKLLKEVHGVETAVTGTITANSANKQTTLTTVNVAGTEMDFGVNTGLEVLGSQVKFYYKDNSAKEDFAKTGYTYVAGVELGTEVVVTGKTTKDELKAALKAVGITTDITDDFTVALLDVDGTVAVDAIFDLDIKLGTTTGKDLVGENNSATLIVVDKKIVAVKAELAKSLEKVGTVTTTADKQTIVIGTDTVKNGYKESNSTITDEINEYEGIAKGDIVVLTKIGKIYNVEKAATVTGKLTKINGTKITLGGVEYDQKGTDNAIEATLTLDFKTEYKLYLDGQGNYIAIDTVKAEETKSTVYFVKAYTKTTEKVDAFTGNKTYKDTYFVQCVDTDGKEVIFQTKAPATEGKGVYEVTLKYDSTDKVDYATFTSKDYKTSTDITAKDIKVDGVYYFADDVKFISVDKSLADLKVSVKTGVQDVTNDMYMIYKAVKDTTNNTVSVVFVDGKFASAAPETVKDVVYAAEKDASTTMVPYADKDAKTQTGYEHVVYVDGVKTTIITDKADALKGFITLTKNGEGYTTAAKTAANLYDGVKVTNVYGTKITFAGLEDIEAADAEIIDLFHTKAADKITSATKLNGATVSIVTDKSGDKVTVATIYVIG